MSNFEDDKKSHQSQPSKLNIKQKPESENLLKKIIENHFDEEIGYKQVELNEIEERICSSKNTLDKLRVCIICRFYSQNGQLNFDEYKNHPTIRELKCEHIEAALSHFKHAKCNKIEETSNSTMRTDTPVNCMEQMNTLLQANSLNKQFNIKISVGNVSKYLKTGTSSNNLDEFSKTESSQYNQDLITHKWMIYIRSPECQRLDSYIKKVIFYLHSSYKPYDIVEVKTPPFQLMKRGWGEFPIHTQIHFKDPRNKRVDINHLLKLDWTQTGLQTFGGETTKECQLIIKPNDFKSDDSSSVNNTDSSEKSNIDVKEAFLNEETVNNKQKETEIIYNNQASKVKDQNKEEENIKKDVPVIEETFSPVNFEIDSIKRSESSCSDSLLFSPSTFSNIINTELNSSELDVSKQNPPRFDISPSDFISTNISSSELNNENKLNEASSSSICFDDLMLNFCSLNGIEQQQGDTVELTKTVDSGNSIEVPNILINEASFQSQQTKLNGQDDKVFNPSLPNTNEIIKKDPFDSKSASLDALLNLRPKSIISTTAVNTTSLPIVQQTNNSAFTKLNSIIKSKQINIQSHNIIKPTSTPNISTKFLNKINPTQSNNITKDMITSSGNGSMVFNLTKLKQHTASTSIPIANTGSKQFFNGMSLIKPPQPVIEKNFNHPENSMTNNRMVIYKVEPSDAIKKDDNKNGSFKPISNQNNVSKLGMALANFDVPIKSNDSPRYFSKSPLSMLKVVNSHNNSESQSKKLKLNPTQLTKVKSMSALNDQITDSNNDSMLPKRKLLNCDSSAEEQQMVKRKLIHMKIEQESLKHVEKEPCLNYVKTKKVFKEQSLDTVKESSNEPLLNSIKQQEYSLEYPIYSTESLVEKLMNKKHEVKEIASEEKDATFESFLKIAMKFYPIILTEHYPNYKHKLPFCASSIQEFYSWSYAKRRANEWLRALHIKRKCLHMLKTSHKLNNWSKNSNSLKTWSTKNVVLWLRSHGYTPLEYQHMMPQNIPRAHECLENSDKFHYVNSFTPVNRILSFRESEMKDSCKLANDFKKETDEQNILIDVVGECAERIESKLKNEPVTCNDFMYHSGFSDSNEKNHIEMCSGSKYVKDQIDSLNLKTNPVFLTPSDEKLNESKSLFSCDLVEKFLFVLTKRFADDLIRQTCADIYFDSSKESKKSNTGISKSQNENLLKKKNESSIKRQSSNSNLCSIGNGSTENENQPDVIQQQNFPNSLGVLDFFNTINKHPVYDFLTNKYMAQTDDTECGDNLNEEVTNGNFETKKSKSNSHKLYNNENITNQLNKKSASNNAKSRNNLNKKILSDFTIIK